MAYRPGAWQGDNLTQELKDAGLAAGNATDYIYDFTISQGGPIQKDKLWFFGTFRDYRTNNFISNTFYDDGAQGDDYNYIKQGLVRLTYQLNQRNKLSAYYDRVDKYRAHDMQSLTDPETASVVWTAPNYSTAALKWTSTISSRLLAEAGYSQNVEYRNTTGQDGIVQARGTADWYAMASRTVTPAALGTRTTAPATFGSQFPLRQNFQASASYVTGSHTIKVGGQWQWGKFLHRIDANADLVQNYQTPTRVGNELVLLGSHVGDHSEHADPLAGEHERGPRPVRAGLVEAEAPHGQLRRALGVAELLGGRDDGAGGTLRAGTYAAGAERHSELEGLRAAVPGGLRPVRQLANRAQGVVQPVQHRADHGARRWLQRPRFHDVDTRVDRPERRQHRAGSAHVECRRDVHRLRLPASRAARST